MVYVSRTGRACSEEPQFYFEAIVMYMIAPETCIQNCEKKTAFSGKMDILYTQNASKRENWYVNIVFWILSKNEIFETFETNKNCLAFSLDSISFTSKKG